MDKQASYCVREKADTIWLIQISRPQIHLSAKRARYGNMMNVVVTLARFLNRKDYTDFTDNKEQIL